MFNLAYFQDVLNQALLAHQKSTGLKQLPTLNYDKRFQAPEWQDQDTPFPMLKQGYLLAVDMIHQAIDQAVETVKCTDPKLARQFNFIMQFLMDACAPTNFPSTNPSVLKSMLESSGDNLVRGYQNLLHDMQRGRNIFLPTLVNEQAFHIGENIATTPGTVIFQNKIMQLIQYTPTTKKLYQRPLLMLPPWINKYYILDLQAHNSMVKWLVDQGYLVFMISWINPQSLEQNHNFADYMKDGPLKALDIISKITDETVNTLGYCVSGALQACTLAYLKAKNKNTVHSATYLTTLLEFSDTGLLGCLLNEQSLAFLESNMEKQGYLDGNMMATIFNMLRPNDLIWPAYIRNYLKAEDPPSIDFLYWNADSTNIPADLHRFYLREFYLNNAFASNQPPHLLGVPMEIKNLDIPSYFLAAKEDHIIPWQGAWKSAALLGGKTRFVVSGSGHVAGVINSPERQKYGYWINPKSKAQRPDTWLRTAEHHEGSWWLDWQNWLKEQSGELLPLTKVIKKPRPSLEAAPGSYVR